MRKGPFWRAPASGILFDDLSYVVVKCGVSGGHCNSGLSLTREGFVCRYWPPQVEEVDLRE